MKLVLERTDATSKTVVKPHLVNMSLSCEVSAAELDRSACRSWGRKDMHVAIPKACGDRHAGAVIDSDRASLTRAFDGRCGADRDDFIVMDEDRTVTNGGGTSGAV